MDSNILKMDANTLNDLLAKETSGAITEEEFVALLLERDGEDEDFARQMYRTSYAQRFAPTGEGEATWLV